MSQLDDIVLVNITRDTTAVSRKGFGISLHLGINKAFTELSRIYTSLTSVASDFSTSSEEYKSASEIFAQAISVESIRIGRRATGDNVVVTVDEAVDNTDYTITVDGEEFTINSGGGASTISIATALVGAINGGSVPVTASDNLDGTFDLDPDVPSTDYTIKEGNRISLAFTTPDTIADDIINVNNEQSDWYSLVLLSRDLTTQKATADQIETMDKIYIAGSADSDIVDTAEASDLTSIAYYAKSQNLDRTAVIYTKSAGSEYPESAWLGAFLPLDPGSYQTALMELSGITVDKLTDNQVANAKAKRVTYFTSVGGVPATKGGKVGSGEWLDVIIGADWLKARITEDVFAHLIKVPKVPYTDAGILAIENIIDARLADGVESGFLAPDPQYTISVPKASEVLPADKASRTLNDVTFEATLAGAINAVKIVGNLSL